MKDQDKTKEQLYEEIMHLRQRLRVLEHDLRNVLLPVIGYSNLLLKSPDKLANQETLMSCLQQIQQAAEAGWNIIHSLQEGVSEFSQQDR
jgi:hypothetical protein